MEYRYSTILCLISGLFFINPAQASSEVEKLNLLIGQIRNKQQITMQLSDIAKEDSSKVLKTVAKYQNDSNRQIRQYIYKIGNVLNFVW